MRTTLCALLCAGNVAAYAYWDNVFNLFAAVFCGIMAIGCAIQEGTE